MDKNLFKFNGLKIRRYLIFVQNYESHKIQTKLDNNDQRKTFITKLEINFKDGTHLFKILSFIVTNNCNSLC